MSKLGIGHFESFQWSMGQSAVPSCLVPGSGVIRAGKSGLMQGNVEPSIAAGGACESNHSEGDKLEEISVG